MVDVFRECPALHLSITKRLDRSLKENVNGTQNPLWSHPVEVSMSSLCGFGMYSTGKAAVRDSEPSTVPSTIIIN